MSITPIYFLKLKMEMLPCISKETDHICKKYGGLVYN